MVIDADPLLAHTQPEPSSPNPLRMAVSDRAIRAEEADLELMKNLITALDTFEGLWSDEGETNPVLATESPLKHLLYLRVTHSLDFYTGLQMAHEDDMAQPLPFLTLPTTLTRVNQHFSTQCRDRLQGIAEVRHPPVSLRRKPRLNKVWPGGWILLGKKFTLAMPPCTGAE